MVHVAGLSCSWSVTEGKYEGELETPVTKSATTLELCQKECISQLHFVCSAINYNAVSHSCLLLNLKPKADDIVAEGGWKMHNRPPCAGNISNTNY